MNTRESLVIENLQQIRRLVDACLSSLQDPAELTGASENLPKAESGSPELPMEMDFGTPVRPFMKKHERLSGTRKFVVMLAWMAKGNTEVDVKLSELESLWGAMEAILGRTFNRRLTSEAKDEDWVESRKHGYYNLRPSWKQALLAE